MNLLVLRCADLARSRDFYAALGFALTTERHGNGPTHYSFQLADTLVELYPRRSALPVHVRLSVSVPDLMHALKQIQLSTTSYDLAGHASNALVVHDPDGNAIELTSTAALEARPMLR